MSRAPLSLIEVWTDLPCVAGSSRVAIIADPIAPSNTETLRGDSQSRVTIAKTDPSFAEISENRILRSLFTDATVRDRRITNIKEATGSDGERVELTCDAILLDLEAGTPIQRVSTAGVVDMTDSVTMASAEDLVDGYILPALHGDGKTWITKGTIDPTVLRDYSWSQPLKPLGLLHMIEEQTECEIRLRRVPTGGGGVSGEGYVIDILTEINASAEIADIRDGKNLIALDRDRSGLALYSAAIGVGAVDPGGRAASIADATFRVTAKDTGTDRLTLEDPELDIGPIYEDDQLNALFAYRVSDGLTDDIVDTIAATQQIQVADASIYNVGDLLMFRASAGTLTPPDDATQNTKLTRPSISYFRLGTVSRPDLAGERNLLAEVCSTWCDTFTAGTDAPPDGWTLSSGAVGFDLQATDPLVATLGGSALRLRFKPRPRVTVTAGAGDTTLTLNTTENIAPGDIFDFDEDGTSTGPVVDTVDSATQVTLVGTVGTTISALTAVAILGAPRETFNSHFISAEVPAIRAPVVPGRDTMRVFAKCFLQHFVPGMFVRMDVLSETNAWQATADIINQSVIVHTACQPLPGETLEVRLWLSYPNGPGFYRPITIPSADPFVSGSIFDDTELVIDGIAITHTDYLPNVLPRIASANRLWHAVQRFLRDGSTDAIGYSCQLADLTAYDAAGFPYDELLVGGTVRVTAPQLGVYDTAIRLLEVNTPDETQPAAASVVLGHKPISLIERLMGVDASSPNAIPGQAGTNGASGANGTSGSAGTPGAPGPVGPAGNPLPPVTSVPAQETFVPVAINASAWISGSELTDQASGSSEIVGPSKAEVWLDPSRLSRLGLQGYVSVAGASGAYAAVEYSAEIPGTADGSRTWLPVDGTYGPWMSIDTTGAQKGSAVAVVPELRQLSLALFRVVAAGGDGSADPKLGNLYIDTYVGPGPYPILKCPGDPSALSCGLSGLSGFTDDWSSYSSATAFSTAANTGTDGAKYFSTSVRDSGKGLRWDLAECYSGHRKLISYIGDNDDASSVLNGVALDHTESSSLIIAGTAPFQTDDVWFRWLLDIESGLATTTTSNGATGMRIGALKANTGLSSDVGLGNATFKLSNGRIRLALFDLVSGSLSNTENFNLGPDTDLIGAGAKDVILHAKKTAATSWRFRVYIGAPCASGIARYSESTHTVTSGSTDRIHGYTFVTFSGQTTGLNVTRKKVALNHYEVILSSVNSNPFGVTP